ncbi:MAG: hypothetical protein IKI95_01650 [Clostridia bacterium]|nr:hypothetical protein [Clostridia bacterium]
MSEQTLFKNGTKKGNIKYYISYHPDHTLEYIDPTGREITLHRIIAKKDILVGSLESGKLIYAGTLGGFVESGKNLSQQGVCWIDKNSVVCGTSQVSGDVQVLDNSLVFDNAQLSGSGEIKHSNIGGNAKVHNADIQDSTIRDNAFLYSQNYIKNGSINIKTSLIDKNTIISNNSQGSSLISLTDTYISDETVINVQTESSENKKQVIIKNTGVTGESQIAVNTLSQQSPEQEQTSTPHNQIKFSDCTIHNATLVLNQVPYNFNASHSEFTDCVFELQPNSSHELLGETFTTPVDPVQ